MTAGLVKMLATDETNGFVGRQARVDLKRSQDISRGNADSHDISIMQINVKETGRRGGDVAKAAEFYRKNKMAAISEALVVANKAMGHISNSIKKSKHKGGLSAPQIAAAVTAIYNGSSDKVDGAYIDNLTGKDSPGTVNLPPTSTRHMAVNLSRQVSAALYMSAHSSLDKAMEDPDSTVSRLLRMNVKTKGVTKTGLQWIQGFKNSRGVTSFFNDIKFNGKSKRLDERRNPKGE